jgi:hypothetical protein
VKRKCSLVFLRRVVWASEANTVLLCPLADASNQTVGGELVGRIMGFLGVRAAHDERGRGMGARPNGMNCRPGARVVAKTATSLWEGYEGRKDTQREVAVGDKRERGKHQSRLWSK